MSRICLGVLDSLMGRDSCNNDCKDDTLRQDECMHRGDTDACQTGACIRNLIVRARCTVNTSGTDCPTESYTGTWVTQEGRAATNCSWSGDGKTWNKHTPGKCEKYHDFETRCEMKGSCDGEKIEDDDTLSGTTYRCKKAT